MVVSWLLEIIIWLIPDAILSLFGSGEKTENAGEARFDSKTGKKIK